MGDSAALAKCMLALANDPGIGGAAGTRGRRQLRARACRGCGGRARRSRISNRPLPSGEGRAESCASRSRTLIPKPLTTDLRAHTRELVEKVTKLVRRPHHAQVISHRETMAKRRVRSRCMYRAAGFTARPEGLGARRLAAARDAASLSHRSSWPLIGRVAALERRTR